MDEASSELDLLPAVDIAGKAAHLLVEWRGCHVQEPARDEDTVTVTRRTELRPPILQRIAADGPAMDILEMAQVQQIVRQQQPASLDLEGIVCPHPGGITVIWVRRNPLGVGPVRSADPNPNHRVALDDGE